MMVMSYLLVLSASLRLSACRISSASLSFDGHLQRMRELNQARALGQNATGARRGMVPAMLYVCVRSSTLANGATSTMPANRVGGDCNAKRCARDMLTAVPSD